VQIEPYKAPAALAPAPGKMSQAAPDASATLVADEATLQPAPTQTTSPVAANGAPSQADRRAAQPPASPQTPPQSATGPAAPVRGLGELAVSAPPSPEASNAAAAASADLKTLEEQIAANPPAGPASSPGGADRGSGTSADLMAPSDYLGQTFDLEGDQSATPAPRRRSPDSLRRRAHSRWRRYSGQQ
jgi:pilus assembly protein FimV